MLSTFYSVNENMKAIGAYATSVEKTRVVTHTCMECIIERTLSPVGMRVLPHRVV